MQNITSDSDILSNCLEQIERGQASIESCLQRYPEFQELHELLHVACIMRQLPAPKLNPTSRSAIEQKMLTRFRQTQAVRARQITATPRTAPRFAPQSTRKSGGWVMRLASAAFILIMVFFTGSAGLVQAASSSVPGDTLYNVKRSVEQFQLSVADKQSIPGVLEQIAEARLTEIKMLSDRGHTLDSVFVDEAMNAVREAVLAQADYQVRDLLLWQARTTFVYAGERGAIRPEKQTLLVTAIDSVSGNNPGDLASTVSNTDPTSTTTYTLTYTATYTQTFTKTPTEELPTNTATVAATLTNTPKPSKTPNVRPTFVPTRRPPAQPTQPNNGNGGGNGNGNGGGNGNGNGGGNGGGNGNGNGGGNGNGNGGGKP